MYGEYREATGWSGLYSVGVIKVLGMTPTTMVVLVTTKTTTSTPHKRKQYHGWLLGQTELHTALEERGLNNDITSYHQWWEQGNNSKTATHTDGTGDDNDHEDDEDS